MTLTIPRETLNELAQLRDRVAELEEEVRAFRADTDERERRLKAAVPRIPVGCARLLAALSYGGIMSRNRLLTVACRMSDGCERNVDSQIKRLRKFWPEIGIVTQYGLGYQLEAQSLRKVRELMGVQG